MNPGHTELRKRTSSDGRRSGEIDAFIPARLAEQRVASGDPIAEAAAERALRSLRGEHVLQPLASSLLRSEGIASSRIEGEVASTRRVFEADYAADAVSDHPAQRIVNSIRVMRDVIATNADGVSPDTFDRWHERLFEGDAVAFQPGIVKDRQNWIGARSDTPVGAEFVAAPPDVVAEAVADLAVFVNRVDVSPVTQAAVAHAHFETIHPYPDGNGRIGRALVYRSWAFRGLIGPVTPPISRVLLESRSLYIDGLTAYRAGDVDAWLRYFFDVVESAVSYTHSLGARLEDLIVAWQGRLEGAHEDALVRRLAADLPLHPITSATDVARRYDVTERGALLALDDLAGRGIVTHRPMRKARRGRPAKVYEATELFALLDLSPRDLA